MAAELVGWVQNLNPELSQLKCDIKAYSYQHLLAKAGGGEGGKHHQHHKHEHDHQPLIDLKFLPPLGAYASQQPDNDDAPDQLVTREVMVDTLSDFLRREFTPLTHRMSILESLVTRLTLPRLRVSLSRMSSLETAIRVWSVSDGIMTVAVDGFADQARALVTSSPTYDSSSMYTVAFMPPYNEQAVRVVIKQAAFDVYQAASQYVLVAPIFLPANLVLKPQTLVADESIVLSGSKFFTTNSPAPVAFRLGDDDNQSGSMVADNYDGTYTFTMGSNYADRNPMKVSILATQEALDSYLSGQSQVDFVRLDASDLAFKRASYPINAGDSVNLLDLISTSLSHAVQPIQFVVGDGAPAALAEDGCTLLMNSGLTRSKINPLKTVRVLSSSTVAAASVDVAEFPIDPVSGFPQDPVTGWLYNPATGLPLLIDPVTGFPINPTTDVPFDPTTGIPVASQPGGNTGGNTGGDTGGVTGGDTGGDTGGVTGGDTGGVTGGDTGGNTGGNTGGVTGGDPEGDTGEGTGQGTEGNSFIVTATQVATDRVARGSTTTTFVIQML
jgi:hypothetical protein